MISYKKYGLKKWQLIGLLVFIIVGLCHSFIANEEPVLCFKKSKVGAETTCTSGIPALIPYSYNTLDKANRAVSPFDKQNVTSLFYRHWLGTDHVGRDVLAGLLAGASIALQIGIFSILLAILIGTLLGYLSGYVGDRGFTLPLVAMIGYISLIPICGFYFLYGNTVIRVVTSLILLVATIVAFRKSDPYYSKGRTLALPLDLIIMRAIEIFRAVPVLFILLVLIGMISKPNIATIIIVVALVRWPSIARYVRAEILKVKEQQFVKAAEALGLSSGRIFLRHVLPLSLSPVIVASAFGISTAILLESTLSFLGLGLAVDQVTWGSMLNGARIDFSLWWLAIFPGLMIYLVIYLFNSIGDNIAEQLKN